MAATVRVWKIRPGPKPRPKHVFAPSQKCDDVEAAWAAGFFDGEGWTTSLRGGSKHRRYLQIGITQKDVRSLVRFQHAVGGGGSIRPRDRGLSAWRAHGDVAYSILEMLWPYLGEAKREQFLMVDADLT